MRLINLKGLHKIVFKLCSKEGNWLSLTGDSHAWCVCIYTITRVGLYRVKWGWMTPESQTLTAVLLVGGSGGVSSFVTIERESQWREPVWPMEQNRGRERERAEGEGRRVSYSGIRQLGQAAWLEADLIVRLSYPSRSDTPQKVERASLSDNRPSPVTHRQDFHLFSIFVKQTDFSHHWQKGDLLDSAVLYHNIFDLVSAMALV